MLDGPPVPASEPDLVFVQVVFFEPNRMEFPLSVRIHLRRDPFSLT